MDLLVVQLAVRDFPMGEGQGQGQQQERERGLLSEELSPTKYREPIQLLLHC